jgi:hypothetical protein
MQMSSKMAMSRLLGGAVIGLLCSQGVRAEKVSPAQSDLAKAERKLEAVRERVAVTAEYLSAAQSIRMARVALLHACQAAHDSLERVTKQTEKAKGLANSDAAQADQVARQAALAVEPNRRDMEQARNRFLNRPLLAYDLAQHGRLTFNTLTGAFDLSLDEGPGISLKAGDLEALLAGRFDRPAIDPLQLAAKMAATQNQLTSNYAEVQANLAAEHGAGNFYLTSRRFLDWATPERLSGELAKAGTARSAAELSETLRQIQLEYEDVASWLRLKGISDLGSDPSAILAELIRTGSYPRLRLSVQTRQVEYTRRLETAGRTDLPGDYLKRLRPGRPANDPLQPQQPAIEKRPALAIIWNRPPGNQPALASHLGGEFRQSAPSLKDLPKLLPPHTDPRIRRLVSATAQLGLLDIDASAKPRRAACAALGLRKEDLSAGNSSKCAIVDLRTSDLGEIVSGLLSQLALGNRNSCNLEVLELDQSNGRLESEFTLRHQHIWPTLREAQVHLRAALGPIATEAEDLADLLPDPTFDDIRKRYHMMDLQAHDAQARAYEAQRRAHEAADCVASKGRELGALASEVARARTDLLAATERENLARLEAQAACAQLLELDAQVRLARNRAEGVEPRSSAARPVVYGHRDSTRTR